MSDVLRPGQYRFSKSTVELSYAQPGYADVSVELLELLDCDIAQAGEPRCRLYKILRTDGSVAEYLTNWESDLIFDDQIYRPARISNKRIRKSLNLEDNTATINVFSADSAIINAYKNGTGYGAVNIEIIKFYPVSERSESVFFGGIKSLKAKGRNIEVKIGIIGIDDKIPATPYARNCPWQIYEEGCFLNRDRFTTVGTINALNNQLIETTDYVLPAAIDGATDVPTDHSYFGGGYAVIGDFGANRIITAIRNNAIYDGHILQLNVTTSIPSEYIGQRIALYPTCDGSFSQCKSKFCNGDCYGGMPFAPTEIEGKPTSTSISGGK